MNLKIALATVILFTGGAYASDAQQKPNISQAATAAKSFDTKVKEYQKAADAAKSASLLAELKQEMVTGIRNAKDEMASADEASKGKLMKKYESRVNAANEVTRLSGNAGASKAAMVAALNKYTQTL